MVATMPNSADHQACEYQPQAKIDDLASSVADEYPLGSVADGVSQAHFADSVVLEGLFYESSKFHAWMAGSAFSLR